MADDGNFAAMATRLHRAFDRALKPLSKLIPRNEEMDRIYHRLLFLWKHGRLPRPETLLWNDVWFRVKTSGEILDPLRVYVTDKQFMKSYVRSIVGDAYAVPRFRC